MKGQNPFGARKALSNYFCTSLVRYTSYIYTPDSTVVHPFVECLSMWIHNQKNHDDFTALITSFGPSANRLIDDKQKIALLKQVNYRALIYVQSSVVGGFGFSLHSILNPGGTFSIALLSLRTHVKGWALLIPTIGGKLPILKFKKCAICSIWIKDGFKDHIEKCQRCDCGARWYKGSDVHDCPKKKELAIEKDTSKKYRKSKGDKMSLDNCFFSDIETFPNPHRYVPYSIALARPKDAEDACLVWNGEDCVDHFMAEIMKHQGVLWYFNGGRFDFYFIFVWCLTHNVHIEKDSLLIRGTTLLTFTIITNVGKMQLKDQWRFTPGSLAANCKSFNVDKKYCKGDFDHRLIRNWEDVVHYRDLYEPYIKNDVFAMRQIFIKYSQIVWKEHHINAHEFMTASHLAYGTWSSNLKKEAKLLKKVPKYDEQTVRQFYRGGRVLVGRPEWVSSEYAKIKRKMVLKTDQNGNRGHFVTKAQYEKVQDFVMAADANSLYPSCMVDREYPIGTYDRITVDKDKAIQKKQIRTLKSKKQKNKEFWHRSAACIDCTCPKDLMIPFLMQKNKDGIIIQNLYNKKREWYTGPELREAVKLGYKIKKIHEIFTWKKSAQIFNEFIKNAYARKRAATKDTPAYQVPKDEMNALSGKFAQMSVEEGVAIVRDLREMMDKTIKRTTEVQDPETGETIAYIAYNEKKKAYSDYPIQLSCFILGWSKVRMSKVLRKAQLLHDANLAMLYGDTDSYYMHNDAWKIIPDSEKSDESCKLGAFKVDIDGKILFMVCLAPKTMAIVYIDGKSFQLMCKIRCKGIPLTNCVYPAFAKSFIPDERQMTEAIKHMEGDFTNGNFWVDIKERIYDFTWKDGRHELLNIIPPEYFADILHGNLKLNVIFGTMKRTFDFNNSICIYIEPDFSKRDLVVQSWWKTGRRIIRKDAKQYESAYPPGHYLSIAWAKKLWNNYRPILDLLQVW